MALFDFFKRKVKSSDQKNPQALSSQAVASVQDKVKERAKEEKKTTEEALKSPIMKNTGLAYRVLLEPLSTEKNTFYKTYAFWIHPKANKQEVKEAIFRVYGVRPRKVNILRMKARNVRWGTRWGKQIMKKKAIVSLPKDKRIEIIS